MLKYLLLACSLIAFTSCYQMHSDDSLRTVPVTNNPNVIPHTAQNQSHSGIPY
jgi:hypothetical protein